MKQLVVISGKGGTGKTSVVAALAAQAADLVLADCDVDAPDLHLLMDPQIQRDEPFSGGKCAAIDPERCTACGACADVCRYDAIIDDNDDAGHPCCHVDPFACEGCGACTLVCPEHAIELSDVVNGRWFVSATRCGPMVHARLDPGQENSGKLVSLVREEARRIAAEKDAKFVLIDGAPGVGCPVIASLTGADMVLIVTEPTLSGRHDLQRVLDLADHFGIPAVVCVNKWDLHPETADAIEAAVRQRGAIIADRLRYDRAVVDAQMVRRSVVEHTRAGVSEDLHDLWRTLTASLAAEAPATPRAGR